MTDRYSPVSESESTFDLIDSRALPHESDIIVKSSSVAAIDVIRINKEEGFFHVEAYKGISNSKYECLHPPIAMMSAAF